LLPPPPPPLLSRPAAPLLRLLRRRRRVFFFALFIQTACGIPSTELSNPKMYAENGGLYFNGPGPPGRDG
jgi:hypothetical protein